MNGQLVVEHRLEVTFLDDGVMVTGRLVGEFSSGDNLLLMRDDTVIATGSAGMIDPSFKADEPDRVSFAIVGEASASVQAGDLVVFERNDLDDPPPTSTLRLAADYDCHPLWRSLPGGGLDNLAAESFGLTQELVESLESWADTFDSTLVRADPARSGFGTERELELFVALGYQLARRVAQQLGESVLFYDQLVPEHVVIEPTEVERE